MFSSSGRRDCNGKGMSQVRCHHGPQLLRDHIARRCSKGFGQQSARPSVVSHGRARALQSHDTKSQKGRIQSCLPDCEHQACSMRVVPRHHHAEHHHRSTRRCSAAATSKSATNSSCPNPSPSPTSRRIQILKETSRLPQAITMASLASHRLVPSHSTLTPRIPR